MAASLQRLLDVIAGNDHFVNTILEDQTHDVAVRRDEQGQQYSRRPEHDLGREPYDVAQSREMIMIST